MGMGGAYAGVSDDAAGIVYNPAGLAFGEWIFDIGQTTNTTVNEEADINGDRRADAAAYQFQFSAVALRLGPIAIAAGQSSPYNISIRPADADRENAKMQIKSNDFLLAFAVSKSLSVGVTYREESLYQSYEAWQIPPVENEVRGHSYTAGISYRPRDEMGFGAAYTPPRKFYVDPSVNAKTSFYPVSSEAGWFKSAMIPEHLVFGGFFRASNRFMYVADLDFYRPDSTLIFVESPFEGLQYSSAPIRSQLVQIPHGGIEYIVLKEKKKEFIWRVGGYREPARVEGGSDRLHFTMGVDLRLGPIVVSAAMDEATGFTNSAQSIGISFGEL